MINVVILGISGSVGSQALQVIEKHHRLFKLVGFSVDQDLNFATLVKKKNPKAKIAITSNVKTALIAYQGASAISKLLATTNPTVVLNAISGSAGLQASLTVINHKIDLALANKESMVMAGSLLIKLAKKNKVKILPVDSEHNAIAQLLKGLEKSEVDKIIITASGGPFYNFTKAQLANITLEMALNHPTWKMGPKISIDSATMFNKGLEVIEAHHLFGVDYSKIEVMINRTSQVHSMIQLVDGSLRAHLGVADMQVAILNALAQKALPLNNKLDLSQAKNFLLEPIILKNYPALKLAYDVGNKGGVYPLVYCVANEIAVASFVSKLISFNQIYELVAKVVKSYQSNQALTLKNILIHEAAVKALTLKFLSKIGG
jgi:1-deoxy-D-xylulose-5-phosphate reductoisomerase